MKERLDTGIEGDTLPLIGRLYEVESLRQIEKDHPAPGAEGKDTAQGETRPREEFDGEMPFIGRILDHVPGVSITVERSLTLEEDLHLADHAFVHAPGLKPLAACLPVVPLTMSLEIMAEAAACLAPGYGLVGFEDVKAARWIELADTDTLPLRITAQHARFEAERQVYRIVAAIHVEGQDTPAIQASVLFAPHYLLDLSPSFTELAGVHPYPWRAEQIYELRHLFHGPAYQCLVGEILLGERGATGTLSVKAPSSLFRSTRRPQLLTDPTLLDAVGQLIGVWAMERERYVFPIGIKKLELYRPAPPPGTLVPVRMEITRDEGKTLYADVEIQDGEGAVWMRIKDWGDWKFRWERRLLDFRRLPTRYLLGRPLSLPALAPNAACYMVAPPDITGFEIGLLARFYLHMDEMPAFSAKGAFPPRQRDWLLGRIAAKDAVRAWLAKESGAEEMLHPAAFAIANGESGQPAVVSGIEGARVPKLSIAHSEGYAIAIAQAEAVGVDIELIRPREQSFLETIATAAERDLVRDFDGESAAPSGEWTTRLWCAKEAAGKLRSIGLDGSPRTYEAQAIDSDGMIRIVHRDSGQGIAVRTLREQAFIIAYAAAFGQTRAEKEHPQGVE